MQVRQRALPKESAPACPWDDLPVDEKSKWMEATEQTGEFISQEVEVSWRSLASKFAQVFLSGQKQVVWDSLPPEDKVGYEAGVRHIVNMVTAEDKDDVKDALEYNWGDWIKAKLIIEE